MDIEKANVVAQQLVAHFRMKADEYFTIVRARGWSAVPLPSGTHLSVDIQTRILSLCSEQPGMSLWAVSVNKLLNAPEVLEVDASIQDLREFNRTLSFMNYVLLAMTWDEISLKWLLICSPNDYLIALGPTETIERLAGCVVKDAFFAFAEYAANPAWPLETRDMLRSVATACLRYCELAPGSSVDLYLPR
jgi:hypothetical protein